MVRPQRERTSVIAPEPPPRHYREPEPVRLPAEPERPYAVATEPRASRRLSWVGILVSFIFLIVGALLGFQAALTIYPGTIAQSDDPYALNLSVTRADENLLLRWDRHAQPIRLAQRGVLDIVDGSAPVRKVDLDSVQLQNGSVSYRFVSNAVRFRLEVYARDRLSITEVVEWKE